MATGGDTRSRLRRAAGKGGELESAGMMRWLLTYADMITLLLALFIILFAISTISKVKLQRLATAISGGFNNIDANNTPPNGGLNGPQSHRAEQADMVAVKAKLDGYVRAHHLQSKVQTRLDKSGLVITLLSDKTYYASGSADLRPETMQLLDEIAGQIRGVKNDLRVEGSTDDVPIATSQYPTNWELSAARATGVTRYLVEHAHIVPTRLSFAGYGEFRPKFPNDSEAHRHLNRRVDVVILNGTPKTNDAKDQDNGDGPSAAASRAGGRAAQGGAPLE
ncbi:MAG: chemotaxis protein MotB [Candidatus Eremiobacteraeota bacterium]|nr:chemotaxis protein MotB [Candidatus Eremiobacteraeota bacterium]